MSGRGEPVIRARSTDPGTGWLSGRTLAVIAIASLRSGDAAGGLSPSGY